MKWVVTLSAERVDVERLLSQRLDGLSKDPDDPRQLHMTLIDPEGEATGEEASGLARAKIEVSVERLNGVGRLRWGRTFGGVSVAAVRSYDDDGRSTQVVFAGTAVGHMLPEDFADVVERLGDPRPALPKGVEIVNGLDFGASLELADTVPEATRAIHLVELMLRGDDEIDWAAGYAALEIVEHHLDSAGLRGQQLGWWTKRERGDFRATANSPEALGHSARHGKPSGLKEARMTTKEASWFVRRVVAQWLTALSADGLRDDRVDDLSASS